MRSYSNPEAVLSHTGRATSAAGGQLRRRFPCPATNPVALARRAERERPVPHGG